MPSARTNVIVKGARSDVYDLFVDRENYSQLVPLLQVRLISTDKQGSGGVGAVHRLHLGPLGANEEIVSLDPGLQLVYKAVGGLPVRSWVGTVEFADAPGGTRVTYQLDAESRIPIPAPVLKMIVVGMARGLGAGVGKALRRQQSRR